MSANAMSGENHHQFLTELPFPAKTKNRKKLEHWMLDKDKVSTFNTCKHRPLSVMDGPPVHIFVDPKISPDAVHTAIPVPVHWKNFLKGTLDRDLNLSVIERVA